MQPARLDLPVDPRATNKYSLLLLQEEFAWRPIEAVQETAPLRLRVPAHGLPGEWPIWCEQVDGFPDLNRDKNRERGRMAQVVDPDTVEFNDLNGLGRSAAGGVLVYRKPLDLTGCRIALQIRIAGQVLDFTTENGGAAIAGLGRVGVTLTAEQSAAIPLGRGDYDLIVTDSLGELRPVLFGDVFVGRVKCHG